MYGFNMRQFVNQLCEIMLIYVGIVINFAISFSSSFRLTAICESKYFIQFAGNFIFSISFLVRIFDGPKAERSRIENLCRSAELKMVHKQ